MLAALSALGVLWARVVSSAPEGTPVLLEPLAPRACADLRVLKASKAREDKEAITRERLRKGELGLDIYNMRERLAQKGLRYVDKC